MKDVSLVRCGDYDVDKVKGSLKRSLDLLGGIPQFFKKDDSVLLKCNLLAVAKPERAATTHPAVVDALITLLKENGIDDISVGDSPALERAEQVARSNGIYEVCRKHKVKIVELKQEKVVLDKHNKLIKRFVIAKELDSFDKIINLPKMKTHSLTLFTGAVKNLFGCIPGRMKAGFHVRLQHPVPFSDMLIDLSNVVKTDLSIMDGILAMEGNGPYTGKPRNLGLVLASRDPLALDRVSCYVFGLKKVPLFKVARARGIKEYSMKNISVRGLDPEDVKIRDVKLPRASVYSFLPEFLSKSLQKQIFSYPVVDPKRCISCGKCEKMCPADAIKLKKNAEGKRVPFFDYRKCIRCYCCHEICPAEAIVLKKPLILRVVKKLFPNIS